MRISDWSSDVCSSDLYRLERPPWVGHIPSFLKVNDPVIAAVLDGSRRSSDGLYRVQTTYTTSLSSAEFLAMVMPFIIHYFLTSRSAWFRLGLQIGSASCRESVCQYG